MPTIPLASLGTPVISDELITQALIPDGFGGWIWISQFYTYPQDNPGEWVVAGIPSGTVTIYNGNGAWLNKKFALTGYKISNQLYAPNGRVFFGAISTCDYYYDPSTGQIYQQPQLPPLPGENWHDDADYCLVFNVDGSMIYAGTIAEAGASDHRPQLFTIDPVSLVRTQYGRIGSTEHSLPAYAYYLAVDGLASHYVYTLVGEDIWDAVATDTNTGASTILISAIADNPWMTFIERPEGWVLNIYTNKDQPDQTLVQYWIVDGALYPYSYPYDPGSLPFSPRTVTPYKRALVDPPQIDTTPCPASVRWRPNGSTGAWTYIPFALRYVSPIDIDGMLVLEDDSILIVAQRYLGWALYTPPALAATFLGPGADVEDTCYAAARGKGYVSGYPNGTLLEFDPTQPYDGGVANPKFLGEYSNGDSLSGVKTAVRLAYDASNQRMYMGGVRDRSGFGAGIGDYDFPAPEFGGTYAGLSDDTTDISIAVFDAQVVLGAKTTDGADGQLAIYDLDLDQMGMQTPNAGKSDTGRLFRTNEATVVIGLSPTEEFIYRWDLNTQTRLAFVDLSSYGAINPAAICDNGDGTLMVQMGDDLYSIDLTTLIIADVGTLPTGLTALSALVKSGDTYYASIGPTLYALADSPLSLFCGSGLFEIDGQDVVFALAFDLGSGAFAIAGHDATYTLTTATPSDVTPLSAGSGAFATTGHGVTYTLTEATPSTVTPLSASSGTFAITGHDLS